MSLRTLWVVFGKELAEARRNKWFLMIAVLFTLLALSFSLLGLSGLGSFGVAGFGRTAASLLNLVLLVVPLMGLLLGAMSVAGEREQGTLATLMAQPVTTGELFFGKFLGAFAALSLSLLVGFGLSGWVVSYYAGSDQIADFLILVFFTIFLGLVFLSFGFLVSVFTRRNSTAIGISLFLWFIFIFLSDLGLMGTAMALHLSPGQLFWMVLLNPAQSFKLAVIGSLQKSLESFGSAGLYAADIFGDTLALFLSAVMGFWAAVPLSAAFFIFRKKCAE